MKTWSIIWGVFILVGVIAMFCGARWMWGVVFISAIMFCGALAEVMEDKEKEEGHGR